MSFKPLTREDVFDGQTEVCYDYHVELKDVRSAVEGLKDVRYYVAEDGQLCHSCNKQRFTFAVSDMNWKPNSQVCAWCWIDKWFPVFSQSHLNDSTYSSEELRPSGSSMTEPANLDAVAIDLPCNPSQRVETVTSHSHSLFPDQEVRDLNNPLEKGGGSEQTSTLTPISARDFSTLAKQMGFSFYVDDNGKLLISLSQPSGVEAPSVASEVSQQRKRVDGEKTLDFFEEKHGVPAGELSSVSVGEVDVKHAPRNGKWDIGVCTECGKGFLYSPGMPEKTCYFHTPRKGCICKHGSGAITKQFVEANKLCGCECHKKEGEI